MILKNLELDILVKIKCFLEQIKLKRFTMVHEVITEYANGVNREEHTKSNYAIKLVDIIAIWVGDEKKIPI